jgi:hypothetical protein
MKMNATYTIRYEYPRAAARIAAWTKEIAAVAVTALMLMAAPLMGLAFIIALPVAGLAVLAWVAMKALARHRGPIAAVAKRLALFFLAPFVGLAYLIAFPFVAMGMLAYYGVRAARG